MYINFILKESEEGLIDLPQTAQEAQALIPDWVPYSKSEITDKFLYGLLRKHKIELRKDGGYHFSFQKDDKVWYITYSSIDDYIHHITIPYKSERLLLRIARTNIVRSCSLVDKYGTSLYQKKHNSSISGPGMITYYTTGEKEKEIYKKNSNFIEIIYHKDGSIKVRKIDGRQADDDILKENTEEKWKYKPDWVPIYPEKWYGKPEWLATNIEEVTDKYLYHIWRKYKVKLLRQRDNMSILSRQLTFQNQHSTFRVEYAFLLKPEDAENDLQECNIISNQEGTMTGFSWMTDGGLKSIRNIDSFGVSNYFIRNKQYYPSFIQYEDEILYQILYYKDRRLYNDNGPAMIKYGPNGEVIKKKFALGHGEFTSEEEYRARLDRSDNDIEKISVVDGVWVYDHEDEV